MAEKKYKKYEKHGRATGDKATQYYRDYQKERRERLREAIFAEYGNECALCGFSNKTALTLDHILGDGCFDRDETPGGWAGLMTKATEYPDHGRYRILCCNCQTIEKINNKHHLPRHTRSFATPSVPSE